MGSRGPSPACGRGASPSPVAYDVVSGAVPVRYVVSGVRCRAWLATVVASLPRSHVVMVELFFTARVTVLTEGMHDRDAYWQSLANEVILAVRASVRSCAAWHTV